MTNIAFNQNVYTRVPSCTGTTHSKRGKQHQLMARRRRELAAQNSLVRNAQYQPSAPVGVVAALASSRTLLPLLRHYKEDGIATRCAPTTCFRLRCCTNGAALLPRLPGCAPPRRRCATRTGLLRLRCCDCAAVRCCALLRLRSAPRSAPVFHALDCMTWFHNSFIRAPRCDCSHVTDGGRWNPS
jgi:hypothetical protein